ncbi:MAG: creatininase family protein [Ignavibacteriales bacterium]|nr:creatininase family protein [Ignavibacteriales bacterium]MCB9259171.1 creatininase family protein [Ignavibacteriales bacterium]
MLDQLVVFDRLEIGPVKVEKKKISAPYTIYKKDIADSIELIYSYEEEVFDPEDESHLNLASMILAQVAINYGLFCKKIVFNGLFDETDKSVIKDWVENTSREIYVKKFLESNPFLVGEVANLKPVKQKKYTYAELEFVEANQEPVKTSWEFWNTDKKKHCILSSGGKDSLLSYGLINELKFETHPIFINESGRHWFTALNAYRHFKDNVPNTSRVWVNSDRVFPFMLRHMPFIRKDFSDVRADIYPIRLWTVAVFLFGVLPLLRKRGVGRLLIGDEYDTTERKNFKGITHYDGLYDQSRYFDENMTRFFMRKGWAISQFSVLRPLSEMLIETILAKRYPNLIQHQVSCHAAHKEEEKIKPCGKCEKCRRIIGMLTAVDVDPKICGYSDKQIEEGIKSLTNISLHQEAAGAEHLTYILHNKKILELSPEKAKNLKPHPEILQVRIDNERSPLTSIPQDLRKPLFTIFNTHATGSVKKVSRNWIEANVFKESDFTKPYPFEISVNKQTKTQKKSTSKLSSKYLWAELTWPEAEQRLKTMDVAILPTGAIEQHGPHLPLDVDAFDAEYLAKKVAEACSDPKPLVLPLVPYGVSYHHDDFKGTISVTNETLAKFIYDIGINIAKQGIKKLLIINGHGDNSPTLNYAAQMINRDANIFVAVDTGETSDVDIDELAETPNDIHAGEIETSTTLSIRPEMVKMNLAKKTSLKFTSRYLNFSSLRGVPWYAQTEKISANGTMGDPTKASAEKGNKIWEIMIAHLVSFVEDLKRMTLDEIHQKKY